MCSGFCIVVTEREWMRVARDWGERKVENNGEKIAKKIAEKIEEMKTKIRCSNFFTCLFRKFRERS